MKRSTTDCTCIPENVEELVFMLLEWQMTWNWTRGCNWSRHTMMTVMAKFNLVTPPKSPAAPITAIIPGSSHAHVSSPLRNKHEIVIIIAFAYLMWRHAPQIELWRTMYCDVLYLRECPMRSLDSGTRTSRRGLNPRLYRTTHRISYKMHYTISIAFRKTQLAFKSPLKIIAWLTYISFWIWMPRKYEQ